MATCLRRLFTSREIATVIDVGANRGQFHRFLRDQVGYERLIVSFEPVPELATSRRSQVGSDRNWVVRDCALGATAGESILNVMAHSVLSSFLQPLSGPSVVSGNKVIRTEKVVVSTLDHEFPDPE
jgi:FkbM family methyltransferase